MKKIILSSILFLTIIATKAQTFSTIDSLLINNLNEKYNGSVVAMVMHYDNLIYYKALGGYDSTTVKAIASLTKTFSGTVMLRLVQDGYINLDDSIGKFIPYATNLNKGSSTIRQNFSHTAGWDGITGNTYLTDPTLSMEQCVDSIITYDPIIYTPGTMFKYTGVSMQVAARVAEIAAGDTWNNLWTSKIKTPLGLNATQFGVINNPRVAGGLVSCPADIIRLASFILNNGKNTNGVQVVDSVLMQELWKDQTNKAPVIAAPYPIHPPYNNPYDADTIRYGIGTWLDIYNPVENYQEQISGAGAFGSIMWVNRCNNTCGVVFTYSSYSKVWETTFQVIDVVNSIYPNQCYQSTEVDNSVNNVPTEFKLHQNYPNPFNPSTTIRFSLPKNEFVQLRVFNMLGQEITKLVDGELNSGEHSVIFNANDLASGVYFYRLSTDTFSQIKLMGVVK
ncbi:MAG: serine hydrolase [Bacteroidota bacterium]